MTNAQEIEVSVVLPSYNEKLNLLELIPEIQKNLSDYKFEIIVVDDNSSDGCVVALKELNIPNLKVIQRFTDRGFAKSIRTGIDQSMGQKVLIMDSDFNHRPEYLPFMIESLKFYPCVMGSRFLYGGGMETKTRLMLSWFFNLFVRITTKHWVTDNLYGLIAIRREALLSLNFDKIFWGYGDYAIRLLYYLQKMKTPILQFPSLNGTRRHGEGQKRFFQVFAKYTLAVVNLLLEERRLKKNARSKRT